MQERKFSDYARGLQRKFQQTKEELRLKAKLAEMDAKDASDDVVAYVDKISSKLNRFFSEVNAGEDQARVRAHLALMEAKDVWSKIHDGYQHAVAKAKHSGGRAQAKLDWVAIRAQLLEEEAVEAVEAKIEASKKRLSESNQAATEEAHHLVDKMSRQVDAFLKGLRKDS